MKAAFKRFTDKYGLKILLFFIVYHSVFPVSTSAQVQTEAEEYSLKAAFIYNFSKYIEWQPSKIENEFIIGIIGSSPVARPLAEIARSKTLNGKKIIIRQFNKVSEITFTNVLFISRNTSLTTDAILAKIEGRPTLTISEEEGLAEQGTAINFVLINEKLKFEANVNAIQSAGLKASSELLKLAIIR